MAAQPYYKQDGITIYHGDCREILPTISNIEAIVTDPPYGINAARVRNSQENGWRDFKVNGWDKERANPELIKLVVASCPFVVIWGGNYFTDALFPSSKWLIWDKGQFDFSLADVEMAWCSWSGAARRMLLHRASALQDGKVHPTQKSIEVMKWSILQLPEEARVIVDPFMGSGTTLRAAKDLGRKAIGIEIEERYCEIAANRLRQGVLWGAK